MRVGDPPQSGWAVVDSRMRGGGAIGGVRLRSIRAYCPLRDQPATGAPAFVYAVWGRLPPIEPAIGSPTSGYAVWWGIAQGAVWLRSIRVGAPQGLADDRHPSVWLRRMEGLPRIDRTADFGLENGVIPDLRLSCPKLSPLSVFASPS